MLENCQKYAVKLFWKVFIWHVLVDLIFYGQWIILHERSLNGPKLVTNVWIDWFLEIHHTCEYKQYCHVGNITKQCRLGLFQDSDFAGDLEDSISTSGGTLCVLGSHKFVPIDWMCKKQISVSHNSTESEIISLDAGLRSDGIPVLDFWDLIVSVFGNTIQTPERSITKIEDLKEWPTCWIILFLFSQTSSLRVKKLYCVFLRTMKQWSTWSLREGVPQWDMFPGPTELRLIGCLIEPIWT